VDTTFWVWHISDFPNTQLDLRGLLVGEEGRELRGKERGKKR